MTHSGSGHGGAGFSFGHSSGPGQGLGGFGSGHAGAGHAANFGLGAGHGGIGLGSLGHGVPGFGALGHGYTGFLGFGAGQYYPYSSLGWSFGTAPFYWPYPVYEPAYPALPAPAVIPPSLNENRPEVDTSVWLIALDGGLVRAVRDYWLDSGVFYYVLRDGTEGSMPLSEVDLPLTEQLNRERGLIFRLPKPEPESPAQIR